MGIPTPDLQQEETKHTRPQRPELTRCLQGQRLDSPFPPPEASEGRNMKGWRSGALQWAQAEGDGVEVTSIFQVEALFLKLKQTLCS